MEGFSIGHIVFIVISCMVAIGGFIYGIMEHKRSSSWSNAYHACWRIGWKSSRTIIAKNVFLIKELKKAITFL